MSEKPAFLICSKHPIVRDEGCPVCWQAFIRNDELEKRAQNADELTCVHGVYHRSPCAACTEGDSQS